LEEKLDLQNPIFDYIKTKPSMILTSRGWQTTEDDSNRCLSEFLQGEGKGKTRK
jgi:hypothetical protein